MPTYVGIAGGLRHRSGNDYDFTYHATVGIPRRRPNVRTTARKHDGADRQRRQCHLTASGMLPPCEHKSACANCTDGTSNTMIVGEQSDWLRHADRNDSTKYHGDPGWGGNAT